MHKILLSEGGPRTNPAQDAQGQVYIVTPINILTYVVLTASFHLQLVSEPKGNIMSSGDFTANNPIQNVMSRTSYTLRQKPLINDKSSSETKTTVIFLYLLNT